jgi:hypothetical protein
MKRTRVKSSNVYSVGHSSDPGNENEPDNTLEIEFNSGGVYRYSPISKQRATACREAESVGRYINQQIKSAEGVKAEKVS